MNKYIVQFNDDIEIPIDSSIIMSSPTLHTLFCDENSQYISRIKLDEMSPQTFTHILSYIRYTKINKELDHSFVMDLIDGLTGDQIIDLIRASDFFQLSALTQKCINKFKEIINNNSISEIQSIFKFKTDSININNEFKLL